MKKIVLIGLSIFLVGCDLEKTSDAKQTEQQNKILQESNRQTGMPAIHNFRERKMLKEILEMRDDIKLVNYAYVYSQFTGKYTYIGKVIGYPIPYSTQYTSPQRPAESWETHESGNVTLPQADPNGLFSPDNSEGTWIQSIDPETHEPTVTYHEERLNVFAYRLSKTLLNNPGYYAEEDSYYKEKK